jgi:ABC-type uncharacterized transport system ATPase subunit
VSTPPPPFSGPPDGLPRLELTGITKRYPSVVANDGVHLKVGPGEIHAVLGENGAGKSTLMKIIYGAVQADAGQIQWNGREVVIANPSEARRLGIGMVFQHFSLFETLTVVENIALALDEPFDLKRLAARVKEVSTRYGLPLDPDRLVYSLSVGERQRVEIVRCLLQEPQLLILDEPTSVLTPQAVQKLFETLRRLSSEGVSILYISHKLHEIQSLCHSATVMRGGKVTGTATPSQETPASLARMMIGRELPVCEVPAFTGEATPVLSVRGLSHTPDDPFGTALKDIALEVRRGEILGIAGISGNGQAELLAALSGETTGPADTVVLAGTPVGHLDAGRRRKRGLTFVPEERLGRGAVPPMSLADNATLSAHGHGLVKRGLPAPEGGVGFCQDLHRTLRRALRRARRGGAQPVRRQPAEVHRRPGDHAAAHRHGGRPAHLGGGRGGRRLPAPDPDRPVAQRRGHPGDLRRAGRAVRDLRPHRRAGRRPIVRGRTQTADQRREDRHADVRSVLRHRHPGARPCRCLKPARHRRPACACWRPSSPSA